MVPKVFEEQFFSPRQGASQGTSSANLVAAYKRLSTQRNHGHTTPLWWEIVVINRFGASATISLRSSTLDVEQVRESLRALTTIIFLVRGLTRKVRVWQTATEDYCLSRMPLRSQASKKPPKPSKAEKSSTFSSGEVARQLATLPPVCSQPRHTSGPSPLVMRESTSEAEAAERSQNARKRELVNHVARERTTRRTSCRPIPTTLEDAKARAVAAPRHEPTAPARCASVSEGQPFAGVRSK